MRANREGGPTVEDRGKVAVAAKWPRKERTAPPFKQRDLNREA